MGTSVVLSHSLFQSCQLTKEHREILIMLRRRSYGFTHDPCVPYEVFIKTYIFITYLHGKTIIRYGQTKSVQIDIL